MSASGYKPDMLVKGKHGNGGLVELSRRRLPASGSHRT